MKIAQNGERPRLFGDVAGQLEPPCYLEGFMRSKQTDDSNRIHFGY